MNFLFQLAVFSFVAFSLLLMVGVPAALAGVGDFSWNKNKTTLLTAMALWFVLVFTVGILNSFVV